MKKSEQTAILQKVTFDWSQRNFEQAFSGVEEIVRNGTPDFKGSAMLLSGMIKEELGRLDDARNDWLSGLEYSRPDSFTAYSLQYNIASSYEKQGQVDDAISWLRRTLNTCVMGKGFSGEQALSDFCRLMGYDITFDDARIVTIVLKKSWRILGVPGKPDTNDLKASVSILGQHFTDIVAMAQGETE